MKFNFIQHTANNIVDKMMEKHYTNCTQFILVEWQKERYIEKVQI